MEKMAEEVEAIRYIMTNIEIQKRMLKDIKNKRETKDNIYDYIRYLLREYTKFNISLRMMLNARTKSSGGVQNGILSLASSISNTVKKYEKNSDIVLFFKEASKINIIDLERVKKIYNIKSKNVIKLIDRMIRFEEINLDMVSSYILEE